MKKAVHFLRDTVQFLRKTIWKVSLATLPKRKAVAIKILRIVILTCSGFVNSRFAQQASALTYYSLLSIAPIIALSIGIAKGFGFEEVLHRELLDSFPQQTEILEKFFTFAQGFLKHTQEGIIAGIGVIVLLWTSINILRSIETSFNEIWGIEKPRSALRQVTDYITIIIFGPILFSLSNGINVFLGTAVRLADSGQLATALIGSLSFYLLKIFPAFTLCFLFSFVYYFMPNTKVRVRCAVVAGVVATILYYIAQWAYLTFQFAVSKYDIIYGSWAALPLFLIWVNISWTIVVIGAKLTYAIQNAAAYEYEEERTHISPSYKQLLSLNIAEYCIRCFKNGETPPSATTLTQKLQIPLNLTLQIIQELEGARILIEANNPMTNESGYQPAKNVDTITIKSVLDALNHYGSHAIPVASTQQLKNIQKHLKTFDKLLENSPANIPLKDLSP
ncbi:MAG: YihY/virulence factor BrkB family protein [Parachlamydiales bacterium]|nr:YihY/virulence factor BrkB family protein [Parachlamydiales bacterium]